MVFTGVMDYRPNVDAVVWFCDEILPIVQTEIPAANFIICGSRPAPAVRRLAKIVHGADIAGEVGTTPESAGLLAIAEGFGAVEPDDRKLLALELPVYDALYEWCRRQEDTGA